ncbi:MAG: hypothetical protein JNJ53_05115 [Rhizobiales bacterium]|nr:hypothetical protein [Hyphomicrobiales bacterium]
MIEQLRVAIDLILAQCLPDWRTGSPTYADYALVVLITALFALACWQCVAALTRGDGPDAQRIKRSILEQEHSHAD